MEHVAWGDRWKFRARYRGLKDWRLWWLLFVGTVLAIYVVFVWFRLRHPVKLLPW